MSGADACDRLIRGYNKGMYTRLEVVSRLIQSAATYPPAELAQALSLKWLSEIQEATSKPPERLDEVKFIDGALLANEADYESYYAQMCKTWHDGAWNWHRHFAPVGLDCAQPEEEP
jgi:hypothetical protein